MLICRELVEIGNLELEMTGAVLRAEEFVAVQERLLVGADFGDVAGFAVSCGDGSRLKRGE